MINAESDKCDTEVEGNLLGREMFFMLMEMWAYVQVQAYPQRWCILNVPTHPSLYVNFTAEDKTTEL